LTVFEGTGLAVVRNTREGHLDPFTPKSLLSLLAVPETAGSIAGLVLTVQLPAESSELPHNL
jgi:hypothetical protein